MKESVLFSNKAYEYLLKKKKTAEFDKEYSPRNIFYVFPKKIREKFYEIIGEIPDFALVPNSVFIQENRNLVKNDGTYILFKMGADGKPTVIKNKRNDFRRVNVNQSGYWVTDFNEGLFEN